MASSTSSIFSGASRYSSDFQSVIQRSVSIASLPLTQLQTQKQTLTDQSSALGSIKSRFDGLKNALQSLTTVVTSQSMLASSTTNSVATAKADSTALPGSYRMEVIDLGSSTTTVSKAGLTAVTSPSTQSLSNASEFTLTINGVDQQVKPEANTLNSLVAALNALPGSPVQATIINLGSSGSPDYRLAVQGSKLASDTISLSDGSNDLLDTVSTGNSASIKLNGIATPVTSDSRNFELAPGLISTIASVGVTTISIAKDNGAVGSAIGNFISAYNSAVSTLDGQRGENAGPLSGQSIVGELDRGLSKLTGFEGSGAISSLADLGITFDKEGNLSFDNTVFQAALTEHGDDVRSFLGASGSGGFLQQAQSVMDGLDGDSGLLTDTTNSLADTMKSQDALIADSQTRVDQLRESLTAQLNAADASIAALEQQVVYVTGLFSSMNGNNKS